MPLERLSIDNVRCIERADLSLDPRCNYFFGPNGAGKTSLLESICLLGRGRSFRTRETRRLLRHGAAELSVYGELSAPASSRRVGVGFGEGSLQIRIDGETAAGTAQLGAIMPVYVIDPKLHQLIEAGPSERRRFIDWGVFHVEPDYLTAWRQYRRVLGQRNATLKAGIAGGALQAWTDSTIELGRRVHTARREYVDALAARVQAIAGRLLGIEVKVGYRAGWRQGIDLAEALEESAERDRAIGSTQVGPHRADLEIRFAEGVVRDAASRGQQKLVVAALVLAQVGLLEAQRGEAGILLVDDPAAELDRAALARLMTEIRQLEAQRFVTSLSETLLEPQDVYPVFHVEQGRFQAVV